MAELSSFLGFTLRKRVQDGWVTLYPATIPSQILGLEEFIEHVTSRFSNNKGFFLSFQQLVQQFPTANPGDYASVLNNGTFLVFVWNGSTQAWENTQTSGMVTSVNGRTGEVNLEQIAFSASISDLKTPYGNRAAARQVVMSASVPENLLEGDFWYQLI